MNTRSALIRLAAVASLAASASARPPAIPALYDSSTLYEVIGANAALLKLATREEPGIAVFAFPSALGKSGLWGVRLPGVLPVIEPPFEIPFTPNLAVDSLIATNAGGFVAYRSEIQFQPESAIVLAGPIRGPNNVGFVQVFPLQGFTEVTDPALTDDMAIFFGARDPADGRSKIFVITPDASQIVPFREFNALEQVLSVVVDSSCFAAAPEHACTLAALVRRNVGPAVLNYVWAEDLVVDIAPVFAGPFPTWWVSLESVRGEVSLVENPPASTNTPPRVLTVINNYQPIDPPRVTFQQQPGRHLNRLENFCGVRALPVFDPDPFTPSPHGPTDMARFAALEACRGGPAVSVPEPTSIVGRLWMNPRGINNRGDILFSTVLNDGSSGLFYVPMLRESCPGDSDCDLRVTFGDITTTLAHWGEGYPPESFCVPMGDSNFDRRVTYADITTSLANWGRDCR